MKKYLMGIDIGGTATKAVIFDTKGNTVGASSNSTPLIVPASDYNERDMTVLWEITADTINQAIKNAKIDSKSIIAIGCTGHGKGLYLWGKNNKPAYNAIASTDHRAVSYIEKWSNNKTTEIVKRKTLQNPIECQPVALLAWLKDNVPQVYANIKWVFEAKDYLRFMLTNEAFAEITDYSGTSLMNLNTKSFDNSLLEAFGIAEVDAMLPPIKYSHENCGYVTAEASIKTGLAVGTPVCGGMFDIDACAIAMNITHPDMLCTITGTWSINEYISKEPVHGERTTLNSLFCIPGYYLIEESSPTSAGNLEWVMTMLNIQGEQREGEKIYETVNRLVEECTMHENDVFFLPFLYGSNSSKSLKGSFLGLSNATKIGTMLQAVYEGVAFSHCTHIERLLKLRSTPEYIRIAGGAAKSQIWLQIFADVIGIPLQVIQMKELGAMGAAMTAGVSVHEFTSYQQAADEMVHMEKIIVPNRERHAYYLSKYQKYKKLIAALESV